VQLRRDLPCHSCSAQAVRMCHLSRASSGSVAADRCRQMTPTRLRRRGARSWRRAPTCRPTPRPSRSTMRRTSSSAPPRCCWLGCSQGLILNAARPPGSCSNYRQSVMLSMLAEAAELTGCQRCRLIVGHITWCMLGVAAVSRACLLTFAGSECGRRGRQRAGDVPEQREAAVAQGGGGRQAAHHHGASASCFLLAVSWHVLLGCGNGQMGSRLHSSQACPG
jgi:hypothetical protein